MKMTFDIEILKIKVHFGERFCSTKGQLISE